MKYDVVVIGGGTAGCAVAYTAGIAGLKVLILEKNIHLGGAITSGLVVPAMNCGNHQINTDFFKALISELQADLLSKNPVTLRLCSQTSTKATCFSSMKFTDSASHNRMRFWEQ